MPAHDDEDLARVRHDLYSATRTRKPHGGLVPVADDAGIQAAVAVDLTRAEESDVDIAALQHVSEQRCHGDDGFGAGYDDRIGDSFGHRLRVRTAHAGFVDEFDVRVRSAAGEVHRESRQADTREDAVLAGERPGGNRHDQFGRGKCFGSSHFRLP